MIQQPDPLSALRDIHLPDPVPFWPLAAGWWWTIGSLALLACASWLFIRHRRHSLKTAAMQELAALRKGFEQSGNAYELALELSDLLRRVALVRFPRRDVASLHGSDWVEFFRKTARDPKLVAEASEELETALYAPPSSASQADGERWMTAARSWIGGIA